MLIEFDRDYRHRGNGKLYRVHEKVMVKMPNGEWERGVSYQLTDDDYNGQTYIRTDKNFVDRFVPIKAVQESKV